MPPVDKKKSWFKHEGFSAQIKLSACVSFSLPLTNLDIVFIFNFQLALFRRTLNDLKTVEGSYTIFECETEKENGTIKWVKEDINITKNINRLETNQGYIYTLAFKHACVYDSGKYRFEKNGICSEATLEVKGKYIITLTVKQSMF